MRSMQVIGLAALVVILAAGCATKSEGEVKLRQGGGMGMYSALDATALTRCFALPKPLRAALEAPGPTLRDGGPLPD